MIACVVLGHDLRRILLLVQGGILLDRVLGRRFWSAQMAQARVAEEVDRGRQQIQEKIDEKLSDKLPPAQQEAVRQLFDAFRR